MLLTVFVRVFVLLKACFQFSINSFFGQGFCKYICCMINILLLKRSLLICYFIIVDIYTSLYILFKLSKYKLEIPLKSKPPHAIDMERLLNMVMWGV